MPILLQLSVGNTLLSEVILVVIIAALLFVIFKLGKTILKLLFGIIANSILGIIAIFALNSFFALAIPISLATLIATAIFGLPAVGTFVILRFFSVPI
jgi:hypothetical protein